MIGSPNHEESPQPKPMVYWVQWFAFVNAIVIYVIVALFVGAPAGVEPSPALRTLPWILGAASVILLALVFGLKATLGRKTAYATYLVIRWALAEAPAVFGLILSILGFPWKIVWIFFAVPFVVLLLLAPTEGRAAEYKRLRGHSSILG